MRWLWEEFCDLWTFHVPQSAYSARSRFVFIRGMCETVHSSRDCGLVSMWVCVMCVMCLICVGVVLTAKTVVVKLSKRWTYGDYLQYFWFTSRGSLIRECGKRNDRTLSFIPLSMPLTPHTSSHTSLIPSHLTHPYSSALDMSQLVASPKGYSSFTLYAVSNHFGTLTGGHCTCVWPLLLWLPLLLPWLPHRHSMLS